MPHYISPHFSPKIRIASALLVGATCALAAFPHLTARTDSMPARRKTNLESKAGTKRPMPALEGEKAIERLKEEGSV